MACIGWLTHGYRPEPHLFQRRLTNGWSDPRGDSMRTRARRSIVPLVVFFALQRYFVRGILAGSVKG